MNTAEEKKQADSKIPAIQVLLSTYNGAAFISAQLDSILAQDYPQVEILARDDGSSDNTWSILQTYAAQHTNITVYRGENLGAAQSFFDLLRHSSRQAAYIAFSDQDDFWFPDKLSRAVEQLAAAEHQEACLYCSRVTMANRHLQPLHDYHLPRRRLGFANALVETPVYGCTTVINRQASDLFYDFPNFVSMHDSWLYMVVSAFGHILYDPKPSMLLRRHHQNTSNIPMNRLDRIRIQAHHMRHKGSAKPRVRQAQEFQRLYYNTLPHKPKQLLDNFLNSRVSLWRRIRYALRGEVYHHSVLGNLMLKGLIILDRVHD